jgi:hypothetical protein
MQGYQTKKEKNKVPSTSQIRIASPTMLQPLKILSPYKHLRIQEPSHPMNAPSLSAGQYLIYTDTPTACSFLSRMLTLSPIYTLSRPDRIVIREDVNFAPLI